MTWSLEQAYDAYPQIEAEFSAVLGESLHPRGPGQLLDLVAGMGLAPGAVALDVGCGEGRHTLALHQRFGFHVTGIDPVRRHLEAARAAAGQDGPAFTHGTAEDIPAGPGTVDLIWCRDVLVHSPDLPRAYAEFCRVLRLGGRALIYQMFGTETGTVLPRHPRPRRTLARRLRAHPRPIVPAGAVYKIGPVRRESSTVIVLVGEADGELMAGLARSGNVSLVRAPAGAGEPDGGEPAMAQPGWQAGALALHEAARRHSPYVVVAADPLAGVAAAWQAMWNVTAGPGGAAGFEEHAAQALAAWREKRFELPDYYLVPAPAEGEGTGPDFYLGPLRAARPRRIAVAGTVTGGASQASQVGRVLDTLRSLPHGPWWPPLDELIGTARHFYAGGLAETQPRPATTPP